MDITLRDNGAFEEARKLLAGLPGAAEKAIARSMNRTLVGVRADVVRTITADYVIRAKDVRGAIAIENAKPDRLQAKLIAQGSALGLERFQYSPKATKPRPAIGVRVRVRRDSQLGPIAGAFVTGKMGGIWRRKDAARIPIVRLTGPAVPSMLGRELDEGLQARAEERLGREIEHEVDFLLSGGGRLNR